jgi:hypothetical protein
MFILNSETLIHQSYLLQPFPPVTVVSVSYYYHLPPFRKKKIAGEIWKKTSCSSLSVSFLPLDSHRNQLYILLLGGISPSLITQLLFFLERMGAMNQSWILFLQNSTQLIVQQDYRSNSNHRGEWTGKWKFSLRFYSSWVAFEQRCRRGNESFRRRDEIKKVWYGPIFMWPWLHPTMVLLLPHPCLGDYSINPG